MAEETVSFREHFEELLENLSTLSHERWEAHQKVHDMGQKAIDASVKALDARLEAMNQFRAQIQEERGHFLDADLYRSERAVMQEKIAQLENYKSNMDGRFWMFGVGMTVLSVLIGFAFRFFGK
jgi:hypothetical protein